MKIVYLILFAAAIILPGCYTVFEHPDVSSKDENGFVYHNDVKFYDDCNSCHNSTDQAVMNTTPSMYHTYRNQRTDRMYQSDSYYSDSFYGDYGYYYNTPWWYQVSQSGSGSEQDQAASKEKYRGGARDNSGSSRNESNDREYTRSGTQGSGLNYTSPTRSSGSSSGSSNTTETTKPSSSSSDSGSRSSSDQPASRNNDGGRSSGSGRR